jgi:[protein-PII] uridylyltransferase
MQNEVGRLRKRLREGRAELFTADARTAPWRSLLEGHTALVDGLIAEIYDYSCRFADTQAARTSRSGLAIAATGGYGRRELNPFSDIDIAFIPSEEEDPWVEAMVHMAFRLVMDAFLSFREIRVGYSYRPLSEVSTWDLVTRVALLDVRHLCGDPELTERLEMSLRQHLSVLELLLELETAAAKQSGPMAVSLYAVEPNLKEGPGSLRDLHRARWIYRLLLGVGNEELPAALASRGYASRARLEEIERAAGWFMAARNWLHLAAGKHSDVLINNYQDRIASELGNETAQQWLAEHYRHAEVFASFRDSSVRTALEGPVLLGGIALEKGCVRLERGGAPLPPGSEIRLLQVSQRYGLPVSLADIKDLNDAKAEALKVDFPSPEESWAFLAILGEGRRVADTVRTMAQLGLLDRFIPGFSGLMRFVPPDPAHRYTVGEHSIRIIGHLEELRDGRDAAGERFSELLSGCAHFDMMCLAALLHDAGKRMATTDHSEAGISLALGAAERLRLPPEKREILETLVHHHLLLVRTARLQDLKSPAVIQQVAGKCRTADALRHLYVFTYADTRAVAERNWTSMDYRDLEDLYRKVLELLRGEGHEVPRAASIESRIGQIRRRLSTGERPLDEEAIQRHCESLPAAYVLNTPLEEIELHLELLNRLETEGVVVDIYNRPSEDFSELTVCTRDDPRPGMLAKITGVLYGCHADIHRAQLYTMRRDPPIVLDTLWVRSGASPISENRARRIRNVLKDVLAGGTTVDAFLKSVGRQPPEAVPVEDVELRNDLSEEHTVVHVVARDLEGLLFLMTRSLSRNGLHIHSAKVATWNARAENNFYVTALTGGQIPTRDLEQWRQQLLKSMAGAG